jgi:molybdate transport system substrate-binding protein
VFKLLLLALWMVPVCLHAQLKIAAAADLQPVLPVVIDQFEKQSHQKVDASYASSATLAAQILNGGPFGLFLSADLSFPQKVLPLLFLMRGGLWCCGPAMIPRCTP